ncbi:hypothetical protein ACLH0K_05135 [Arthrobacter sp. MPF02]|uniref:hypothetical protein n=1 Tax=Arthrobacter sp. MPF02 TaxID=3388492 RepID=UPI003984C696
MELRTEGTCWRPSKAIGVITICAFSGTDGDCTYVLIFTSPDLIKPQLVTLIVRPHQ